MTNKYLKGYKSNIVSKNARIIPFLVSSASKNMAIDMFLLDSSIDQEKSSPTLRFYQWKKPCLSIGRNQKIINKNWIQLHLENALEIIRRPSGGGAVLHDGGLTYSLVWPNAPKNRHLAYKKASQLLINTFQEIGIGLTFGDNPPIQNDCNCFSTSTQADLVDENQNKLIGSAQLWSRGYLLQHGEILLNPNPILWEKVFKEKAPKPIASYIKRYELEQLFLKNLSKEWPQFIWEEKPLTKSEILEIKQGEGKYQICSSLEISTKPDEIIESTTLGNAIPNG